jgi:hypothetical protein
MRIKLLALVVAVLLAFSAVAFWINRPAPPAVADARVGQPLIDTALLDRSAGLRFSDQGKTIELARGADGVWRDRSYFGLPADFAKLSSFATDLSSSKIQRFVTANPERIARLDFKDTKIEILNGGGGIVWSATLGKNADGGGRFVEFDRLPRAYLTPFTAWLDTDPKSWADATLVNLKPEDIARVEISFDQGAPLALSRAKKDGPWSAERTPAGQRIKADAVASLLGAVGSLRFSDTSDPADPAAVAARRHERTITITPFSGPTIEIALGRQPESKNLKPVEARQPEASAPAEKTGSSVASNPAAAQKASPARGAANPAPEYETIPAGPVYAFVISSDPKAPVNAMMKKRAFQIDDNIFTSLPRTPADLFEPAAPPAKPAP